MKEIVVNSFEKLQELVFKDCYDAKIKRYRNDYVYRGVSDDAYPLITTLNRECSHNLKLEDHIIRSFRKYGFDELKDIQSFWQILATGQHFGLPTRLLDWTYSPLVAAHFVTVNLNDYDKDGAIYCIDTRDSIDTLPTCLKNEALKKDTGTFTVNMLERHAKNLDEFASLSKKPFFLFFEPASGDNRMINQYSLFSVSSDPKVLISDMVDEKKTSLYKIIIPKQTKLEIRDKLDYINITERVIYPGLDSVCSWIARRYSNLGGK